MIRRSLSEKQNTLSVNATMHIETRVAVTANAAAHLQNSKNVCHTGRRSRTIRYFGLPRAYRRERAKEDASN